MSTKITGTNFQKVARGAIAKYFDNGNIVDGLMWARICEEYEAKFQRHVTRFRVLEQALKQTRAEQSVRGRKR